MTAKTAILLANLGTPEAPTEQAVRAFLKPFLKDRRVVEIPRPLWLAILYGVILPFRPKSIAKNYQALFDEAGGSPLRLYTESQVKKLQSRVNASHVVVDYVFTYGKPQLASKLDELKDKVERVIIVPLYPQYSCSTTAALYDQLANYQKRQRNCVDAYIIKQYFDQPSYQAALVQSVESYWQAHGRSEHLLMSYHGVPKAYREKGDPYYDQCMRTSNNLAKQLGLSSHDYTVSFQSRLGKAEWLKPYTDETVRALAKSGVKTLDVVCPSFSVDCLETLEEIAMENHNYFTEKGGQSLRLIPCLNDSDAHVDMMAELVTPFIKA